MRDLFAKWAVPSGSPAQVTPVTLAEIVGVTCREAAKPAPFLAFDAQVTPVTPVTPEIRQAPWVRSMEPDHADLMDAYEERAAILEFDAHLTRGEAERQAWAEVFGYSPRI